MIREVFGFRKRVLSYGVILLLTIVGFLTSCRYSDNISLSIDTERAVTNYSDSTKVVFISKQKAWQRPEGLAAFPDGGQSKIVYEASGLYAYDSEKEELTYLKDLTKKVKPTWYVRLRSKLVYKDNLVYYQTKIDTLKPMDSLEYLSVTEEFVECITIDVHTKETNRIDTTEFNTAYEKYKGSWPNGLGHKLAKLPIASWGIILKEIYPKSDEAYIDYFISWKNGGNSLTRRAIFEQIIANKTKDEIKDILKRMDKYKDGLDVYDKSSYEFWMKDDYERLRKLLED